MPFWNTGKRIFTRETLTVSTAVKTLTASVYNDTSNTDRQPNQQGSNRRPARAAVIVCETNAIRVTKDGTTPVAATTGTKLNPGDTYALETYEEIVKFQAVRDGASDGTVQVDYYRNA